MQFDLQALVQNKDLQSIQGIFTKQDINNVIKYMPSDKAPGPDGFNGVFLKKCWTIIKEDIYHLCFDFFSGRVDLQAINSSFITLVPKVNSPTTANDFRPISLINCVLKIITKMMGDRLQSVILSLVHKNQYWFIKSRTIQDYIAWAFEYIYQCKHSKQEIVILKLDFTKAFDTIEHSAILEMMKTLGFSKEWLQWTSEIIGSASKTVLLNGIPGNNLHCKRGVRRGDPMSPLLFVLVAELLQCVINKAHLQGLFQLPIPSRDEIGSPINQYADDTILVMKVSQTELLCLKALLQSFDQSTGLRVNYAKSYLVPLNLSDEKAEILAGLFGYKIQGMSFTYLGLPMGITKPRVALCSPNE
jgi:hypothetical protein